MGEQKTVKRLGIELRRVVERGDALRAGELCALGADPMEQGATSGKSALGIACSRGDAKSIVAMASGPKGLNPWAFCNASAEPAWAILLADRPLGVLEPLGLYFPKPRRDALALSPLEKGKLEALDMLVKHVGVVTAAQSADLARRACVSWAPEIYQVAAAEAVASLADFGAKDSSGFTALMNCARANAGEMCAWLVERCARLDERGPTGQTALMLATRGRLGAFEQLIALGADASLSDESGANCAHWAAASGCIPALMALARREDYRDLMSAGDKQGRVPLDVLALRGTQKMAQKDLAWIESARIDLACSSSLSDAKPAPRL